MAKSKDRPRLARGLASLITVTTPKSHPPADESAALPANTQAVPTSEVSESPVHQAILPVSVAEIAPQPLIAGGKAMNIAVETIDPNPNQPRQGFSEASLKELSDSMAVNGVIQPIIVRPAGEGRFQLIAGERRWRAAKMAKLATIPAIIREVDTLTQAQLALIENIQREDLNPIDRACGYQTLIKELGLTQNELAARLGEERSTIANYLRLLDLCQPVRELLRDGKLSVGHAKLLAGVADMLKQNKLANIVVSQGLSVRNLERILQEPEKQTETKPARASLSPHMQDVEKTLCRQLGLRVQLRAAKERGKGRIILNYANLDQFDEIIDRLGVNLAAD